VSGYSPKSLSCTEIRSVENGRFGRLIARTRPRPLDLSRTEILPSGGREAGIARSTPLMKGSVPRRRGRVHARGCRGRT
jgi:hypothetical protein